MVWIDVKLRDKKTAHTGVFSYECEEKYLESQEFMWSEGNFSCDCNRGQFLYGPDNDPNLNCNSERIACDEVRRRDTGEVLYSGDGDDEEKP